MFIVLLKYKKSLDVVDQYLAPHRSFLDEGYAKNFLIASGPRNPRTGGVFISQLKDRATLENFVHQDPFYLNDIAEYEIIEFTPIKHHIDFAGYL